MLICRHDALIEVQTPAKVNLFLEVLQRRADGFHDLETLIVPIDLYDTLLCSPRADGQLRVTCRWTFGRQAARIGRRGPASEVWGDLPAGDQNLVFRALQCFRQAAGIEAGAEVMVCKRIPAAAGLGGASSDAAAALVAANRLWGTRWPRRQLAEVAAEVGSDVPFFLSGSAAICRGRGEQIETIDLRRQLWLVVVRPPVGLSTADVYRGCRTAALDGARHSVSGMREAVLHGDPCAIGRQLFNRLQPVAQRQSSWIARLNAAFASLDCLGHQMSGSGSSYFGVCRHAGHARRVAVRLATVDPGAVFVTATLGTGLVPAANQFKEEHHADHRGSHQAHGENR